jgi:hypothetical protein
MKTLNQPIKLLCLIFCCLVGAAAQSEQEAKPQGSVIAGQVTLNGKPVRGILVSAVPDESLPRNRIRFILGKAVLPKANTGEDGRFRIHGVEAGRYVVSIYAPSLLYTRSYAEARPGKSTGRRIAVGENEIIEDINFSLLRGGVITGRVIYSDGKPAIGETVKAIRQRKNERESYAEQATMEFQSFTTDDRGIYRIYGLAEGFYKIVVGDSDPIPGLSVPRSKHPTITYYPGVIDGEAAREIEVVSSQEIRDVDIKIGIVVAAAYTISGRVIDGESGKPVAGAIVQYSSFGTSFNPPTVTTNAAGEFKIRDAENAHYMLEVSNAPAIESQNFYSEKKEFNLKDANVEGLEIRLHKAVTMSGKAVIDGSNDPEYIKKLAEVKLYAISREAGTQGTVKDSSQASAKVAADGSFIFRGLRPGSVYIRPVVSSALPGFWITRVERVGADKRFELHKDESINDVQVLLAPRVCKIRGQIKIVGGLLPKDTVIKMYIYRVINGDPDYAYNGKNNTDVEVDASGRFFIGGLIAGDYTLDVTAELGSASEKQNAHTERNLSLSFGQELEIEVTLDLSAKKEK